MSTARHFHAPAAVLAAVAVVLGWQAGPSPAASRANQQYTQLISRNIAGDVPNGPSGNSVISNDKRYARVIAFESEASDLVPNDTNGQKDVFAVERAGSYAGDGLPWIPGPTTLISRTASGAPANGPSFSPSVDGAFEKAETVEPKCVAFLSAASNIVPGDTNGHVDAFVTRIAGGPPKAISPDVATDTQAVAASGDCSLIAMVAGDSLYLYDGKVTRLIKTDGAVSDPSFSTGRNQDLVFATPSGVWLLEEGDSKPRLVARGGRNPAYNDVKRQVVAYEKSNGAHTQIMFRDLGKSAHLASGLRGAPGDGNSRKPVIGNSGYAIAFETDAGNLGVNSLKRAADDNGATDVYVYTGNRDLTLLESTEEKAVPLPAGGRNPGMNFYNNYVTFDSPAPLGAPAGPSQVFMRYLGALSGFGGGGVEQLPAPTSGETANVVAERGTVTVRLPAGTSAAKAKKIGLSGAAVGFVPLSAARQVPMGSTFNTTKGTLGLYTASGLARTLQDGHFNGGQFNVKQGKKNPLTTLTMSGGTLDKCGTRLPRGGARKVMVESAKRRRRVFSSVHGRYRTRGRNSSATVRGTQWTMTDTCAGTLTAVKSGAVVVRDFNLRKTKVVTTGKRYFAHSRDRRKHR